MAKRKPPYFAFGRRIALARKAMKMTQKALAEKVGITPVFANRIERGHNEPSLALLQRIAAVLNTTRSELLK